MGDQTIVVLESEEEERGLPLPYVTSVIRWLRGEYSGDSTIVEGWLVARWNDRYPGPGSRMKVDDHTALVVKRCVIVPQQARSQQNQLSSTDSGPNDFDRMIDVMTKMTGLSMHDF